MNDIISLLNRALLIFFLPGKPNDSIDWDNTVDAVPRTLPSFPMKACSLMNSRDQTVKNNYTTIISETKLYTIFSDKI